MKKICVLVCATALLGVVSEPLTAQSIPQAPNISDADVLPDSNGDGPHPAIMTTDYSLPNHVLYFPANLSAFSTNGTGKKLGVFVWGNGGCMANGASARHHLAQIASYGYLVIAPGEILSGPNAIGPAPRREIGPDGKYPPVPTSSADVIAGLDWALAENEREGSAFFGLIDANMVAVGGHSCGGLQALELAADPRVKTVMIHNSGVYNEGFSRVSGMNLQKSILDTLHTPVLYVLGGPSDIAFPNGSDDVARINHVPVFLASSNVGHGGTFQRENGGAVGSVSVDWLEWQLRGDLTAARTFTGDNCRLCQSSEWTVTRKMID